MEAHTVYELIGYAASILVAISLTLKSILRLRLVNLIGAATFTLYGLLIRAYPVAALNFVIVLINLYYLRQMFAQKPYFSLLEISKDSEYLARFLKYHEADIRQFFPDFRYAPTSNSLIILTLRDLIPVGLFIAEREAADRLFVQLDFVIPGYRDLQPARHLYDDQADHFRTLGIRTIYSAPGSESHRHYLRRMGFTMTQLPDHGEVAARAV